MKLILAWLMLAVAVSAAVIHIEGPLPLVATVSDPDSFNFCGTNGSIELDENMGSQGPYPINFAVSGLVGNLSNVTVTLTNFTHNWPADLQMVLVAPDNTAVKFWGGAGGDDAITTNVTIILSDAVGSYVPTPSPGSGTYKPTDTDPTYVFPAGPPVGPYSTNFSTFDGMSPATANGLWKIYIADDTALDGGFLTNVCISLQQCSESVSPYLVKQDFEGNPFDHCEIWVTNGAGTAPDYIGTALSGTKSLHITNAAVNVDLVSPQFGNQAEVWAYFLMRPVVIGAANEIIAAWMTDAHNQQANLVIKTDGKLQIANSAIASTVDSVSVGVTYHVWFHYKPSTGANGVLDVGFSTDGIRPTSGNKFVQLTGGNLTSQIAEFSFMRSTGNPNTLEIQFDNARVDDAQIGDNPP